MKIGDSQAFNDLPTLIEQIFISQLILSDCSQV